MKRLATGKLAPILRGKIALLEGIGWSTTTFLTEGEALEFLQSVGDDIHQDRMGRWCGYIVKPLREGGRSLRAKRANAWAVKIPVVISPNGLNWIFAVKHNEAELLCDPKKDYDPYQIMLRE